jgi:helicase
MEAIADSWFAHLDDSTERVRQASLYVYSTLVGQVPWGMGAVQRLALDAEAAEDVGHVPSLVFYGVASREAAQLRMAGVPRVAAEGLATAWRASETTASTFADIRSWVGRMTDDDWHAALPTGAPLSGAECRRLWSALMGAAESSNSGQQQHP